MNIPYFKILKKDSERGVTLIEIIIYFTLLAIMSGVVINSLFSLFSSYGQIKVIQDMETTAILVLDKLNRDIQSAQSVNIAQSSFGIPESYLTLTVPNTTGGTDTIKYYATSSKIKVDKNGAYLGTLSLSSVSVNNFIIRQITSSSTSAFKVELGLQGTARNSTSTIYKNFYTTAQLREE